MKKKQKSTARRAGSEMRTKPRRPARASRGEGSPRSAFLPRLERLEERAMLAAFTAGDLAILQAAASATNTTASIVEINTTTAAQTAVQTIAVSGTGANAIRISGSATSTGYVALSSDHSLLAFTGANSTDTASNVNTLNPRAVATFDSGANFSIKTTYTGSSGSQTRGATSLNNSTWYIGDQGGFYTNSATTPSPTGNYRSVKTFGGTVYAFTATTALPPVGTISAPTGGTFTALPGLPNGANSMQDFYLVSSGDNGTSYDVLYVLAATSATAGTISKYSLVSNSWAANGSYTTNFGGFGLVATDHGNGADLYVTSGTGATTANNVIKLNDTAGYNATIAITTANNVTLFTTAAGTILKGLDFVPSQAANAAPVNNVPATQGTAANTNLTFSSAGGNAISISDADAGAATVQVQLSVTNGTLSLGGTAGLSFSFSDANGTGAGTGTSNATMTFRGTIAAINTALNGLVFAPTTNFGGAATLTIVTNDLGNTGSGGAKTDTDTVTINVAADAPPVVTSTGTTLAYTQGDSATPIDTGLVVTDSDSANLAGATVTVSAGYVSGQDVLAFTNTATITGSFVAATGVLSLTGTDTPANYQAALRSVTYVNTVATGNINTASRTISFVANDGQLPSTPPATRVITITALDKPPVNSLPTTQFTTKNASVVFSAANNNLISISDPDAGTASVQVQLTATSGTLTLSGTAGLSFSFNDGNGTGSGDGTADATMTFRGTITAINTALAGLIFAPTTGFQGSAGLQIVTNDLGNTGPGGPLSASNSLSIVVAGGFSTGDLVVLTIGDGTLTPSSSAMPVFLKEFSTTGTSVQTVPVPVTTNGSNAPLTLSGTASSEGALTRSADGRYLAFGGYGAAVGTASVANTAAATVNRIVARVDGSGVVDTSTHISDGYDANNFRGAVTSDGTGFWGAGTGTGGGTRYVTYGNTAAGTSTQISSTPTNTRVPEIFNGQLYVTSASGANVGINTVGTGLPTTSGQTTSVVSGLASTNSYAYMFLDRDAGVAGLDTLYVADQSAGLLKYSFDGTSWTARGAVAGVLTGLTAKVNGATVDVYATQGTAAGNALVKLTDTAAFNAGITGSFTTLATAAANTVFRGVAFAPQADQSNVFSFPTPLASVAPAGSLIYGGTTSGTISTPAGTDSYTINLDAGQTVSLLVHPSAAYTPTVSLLDPSSATIGSAVASAAGADALVQTITASTSGTYTIVIGATGGTSGTYSVQLTLNARLEAESHGGAANNAIATAEDLDASAVTIGASASRLGALGTGDASGADFYAFTLAAGQTVSLAASKLSAGSVQIVLQNSAGVTLATGTSAGNLDAVINNFAATTAGTYYVQVTAGTGVNYSLVVTREVDFDTGTHDTSATAQNISATGGALGQVGSTATSVTAISNFAGLNYSNTAGYEPPDTISAVGPNHLVEAVNTTLRIYNKSGTVLFTQSLDAFFAPLGSVLSLSDPVVAYDEIHDRYIVGLIDFNDSTNQSRFDVAVSNTGDPTGTWEMHRVDMVQPTYGFADYPKMGWNADVIVVSFNMFGFGASGTYGGVQVLAIDSASIEDGNNATFASSRTVLSGGTAHYTATPAVMHGATSGGPMYLVESVGTGNTVGVIRMTNVLSATPTFTETQLTVTAYLDPPAATQPGGTLDTIDSRIFNAEWRGNRLVAAHTVGLSSDSDAHAAWVDINTSGVTPTLTDQGILMRTAGTDTFFPTVALASDGRLGFNFMQSGPSEYMSMYVTGRAPTDAVGTMRTAMLVKAGDAKYTGTRAGDYSGIGVDPVDDTFWASNEVKVGSPLWSTWISHFNIVSGAQEDWYKFDVNVGDALDLRTFTPAGGSGEFVNGLDPTLELYGPTGTLVASDTNGGGDGRNAHLTFAATTAGTYRVRVLPATGTQGEYLLQVQGATAGDAAPFVDGSTPATAALLTAFPTTYTLHFSEAILASSVQPSDLVVGGKVATSVVFVDGQTLQFGVDPTANIGDGTYTVVLAAGAVADLHGHGNTVYNATFVFDATGPRITSTSWNSLPFPTGGVFSPGALVFQATFNENLTPRIGLITQPEHMFDGVEKLESAGAVDVVDVLTGATYEPSQLNFDRLSNTYSFNAGVLPEGNYTLTLNSASGAFDDDAGNLMDGEPLGANPDHTPTGDGTPGGDYVISFTVDVATQPLPNAFAQLVPAGGLAYYSLNSTFFNGTGDTDSYTFALDAGQTITVAAQPAAGVAPTLLLKNPAGATIGTASAAAGTNLVLQTITAATAGTYTLIVGGTGTTAGTITFGITLNAAAETEPVLGGNNDTPAAAQSLDGSALTLATGIDRLAVVGQTDVTTSVLSSTDVPQPIADVATTTSTLVVGTHQTIRDLNLSLDLTHTYDGDLKISLISPTGVTVVLVNQRGGNGQNFTATTFDDEALTAVTAGTAPYTGSFRPEEALSAFDGLDAFGTWTLKVEDLSAADTGTLNSWSLAVQTPAATPDFYAFTLAAGQSTSLALATTVSGSVQLQLQDAAGTVLATGASTSTLAAAIGNYVAAASGTYYVMVSGGGVNYDLIVTRNADFDRGGNNALATAQSITVPRAALGFVDTNSDYYSLVLPTPGTLTLATSTPGDGPNDFVNTLDPAIELYDGTGTLVGSNTNGAADGRNALLGYSAAAGTYTVRVLATTGSGEYLLQAGFVAVVNQPPINTVPLATLYTPKNVSLTFSSGNGNAISIADPDAGTADVQVTLTATNGTLSLGSTANLTSVNGNNSASVIVVGSITNINTALNGLQFLPTSGYSGAATAQVVTSDLGNTGSGGPLTDTDTVNLSVVTPPTVESVVINGSTAGLSGNQRSVVSDVTVTFSGLVTLDATAFNLVKNATGGAFLNTINLNSTVSTVGGKTVVVLTFSGTGVETNTTHSLSDGNYVLTITGTAVHDLTSGINLDGDGDGAAGGNKVFGTALADKFFRLFGDSDGDRDCDNLDYARFRGSFNKLLGNAGYLSYFNFDGDSDVDNLDYARFRSRFNTHLDL